MISHPLYFNEWDVPPAGIDTISLWIHPYLINKHSAFHGRGNANEAVNLRKKSITNRFIKKTIWTEYIIDIQAEAINPNANIFYQVLEYIIMLFKSGILAIQQAPCESLLRSFLIQNFNRLFALDFIDFYFDVKEEDAVLSAVKGQRYPNARCCKGFRIKTYDRIGRLKQKHTIKHQLIDQMKFPRRIEFHLTRRTCGYLNCINLDGDFNAVFFRFLNFLARKWLKYKRHIIDIPNLNASEYHYLKQINSVAFSLTIPHTKSLAKTPRKPIPNKKAKDNETDCNWLPQFIAKKKMPEIQS